MIAETNNKQKKKEDVRKVHFYCHSDPDESGRRIFHFENRCFDFAQHDSPIQDITFWTSSFRRIFIS